MAILTETAVDLIPTGTWSIDPAHSVVEFAIEHLGIAEVTGRAPVVAGTIEGGRTPSITGTAAVPSITTFDEMRDGHLQSPEFFDAERHPELRFESTRIDARDGGLVVEGDLTVKGITRRVELHGAVAGTGRDPFGNERLGLRLATTVDRTEWDLNWNAPLPDGGFLLPDEVTLTASFSAIKSG